VGLGLAEGFALVDGAALAEVLAEVLAEGAVVGPASSSAPGLASSLGFALAVPDVLDEIDALAEGAARRWSSGGPPYTAGCRHAAIAIAAPTIVAATSGVTISVLQNGQRVSPSR
jgi:hypothetical protein